MLGYDVDGPIALVNLHVTEEGCEYKHIPVEMTVPAAVPRELRGKGAAFRLVDRDGSPLLTSAVKLGTFLYLDQIKSILTSLEGVPPMAPGSGSGKRGNFVKLDFAVHLVKFLAPDSLPEEHVSMVRAMCHPGMGSSSGEKENAILEYLSALDAENAEAFKDVKKMAEESREEQELFNSEKVRAKLGLPPLRKPPVPTFAEEKKSEEQKLGADESEVQKPECEERAPALRRPCAESPSQRGPKRVKVTPKEFKDLFPPESEGKLQCFHDPNGQVYRISYPTGSLFVTPVRPQN